MSQIVAIVGRPNVGKSTLFNRLIGKSTSIIDDVAGITRDRHYDTAEWSGHMFTVIDTGGYSPDGEKIDQAIAEQAEIAISEASVVLFVIDSQKGLNAQDTILADLLRRKDKPVLVVANKADNAILVQAAYEHHALGLGEVYPISATHGSGTGELLDAIVHFFPPLPTEKMYEHEEEEWPKIALIGKPNVGKSTFLNALIGEKRSIVADKPHTTRTPVHTFYRLYNKKFVLVDTAGIRKKAQVAKKSLEFYAVIRSVRAIEQADVCIMLLDAQEGLTHQDKNIMELAVHKHKGLVILVNKWDLIEKTPDLAQAYKKKLLEELAYMTHLPILFTSGLHKKGIYQAIERALQVAEQRKQRISTATLNKILLKAIAQNPPPMLKGKQVKMNYITQLPNAWPSFAIFCNLPQYIPTNYKRYLEKQFRVHSDFTGVPITLVFKKK